jgi:two-component system sensor histidine kinase KdpD
MAHRVEAELYVIYVDVGADDSPENRRTLQDNLRFADNVGAQIVRTTGKNVAEEVVKIVREKHITQVVFGRSAVKGWKKYLYLSAIHRFLRDAPSVDVHIVTQEAR